MWFNQRNKQPTERRIEHMDIKIQFSLDNAYFQTEEDLAERRVCDMLTTICREILAGKTDAYVIDGNGNTVGGWIIHKANKLEKERGTE
jgi:hypothetical protein